MNLSIVYFIVGNWTYLIATCKPLTDKIIELFSCHSLMYIFVFCFFKFFAVFFLINFCKLKDLIVFLLVYLYMFYICYNNIIIHVYTCIYYIQCSLKIMSGSFVCYSSLLQTQEIFEPQMGIVLTTLRTLMRV